MFMSYINKKINHFCKSVFFYGNMFFHACLICIYHRTESILFILFRRKTHSDIIFFQTLSHFFLFHNSPTVWTPTTNFFVPRYCVLQYHHMALPTPICCHFFPPFL